MALPVLRSKKHCELVAALRLVLEREAQAGRDVDLHGLEGAATAAGGEERGQGGGGERPGKKKKKKNQRGDKKTQG